MKLSAREKRFILDACASYEYETETLIEKFENNHKVFNDDIRLKILRDDIRFIRALAWKVFNK